MSMTKSPLSVSTSTSDQPPAMEAVRRKEAARTMAVSPSVNSATSALQRFRNFVRLVVLFNKINTAGRRRMLRQTVSQSKPILAVRIFNRESQGIGFVYEDGEISYFDPHSCRQTRSNFVDLEGLALKAAAFSSCAPVLAAGLTDNSLRVFNLKEGTQITVPIATAGGGKKAKAAVRVIAWSSDDALVGTGGEDNTARIFDATTGALLYSWKDPHTDFVVSVAFSSDSRLFVTGCKDKNVRVFELKNGTASTTPLFKYTLDRAYALAFSPNDRELAIGTDANLLHVMDMKTGEPIHTISAHNDYVRAVGFSMDGRKLMSGGKDGSLKVFDADSGEEIMNITRSTWVTEIAMSPISQQFVTCSQDASGDTRVATVYNVFEARSSEEITALNHGAAIQCLCFDPLGTRIILGGKDKKISIYNISTSELVGVIEKHKAAIVSLDISPCSTLLASVDADGVVVLSSPACESPPRVLDHKSSAAFTGLKFSPCGKLLVLGDNGGGVSVFNYQDVLVAQFAAHGQAVTCLALSKCSCSNPDQPCEARLVTGSADNSVRVFDLHAAIARYSVSGAEELNIDAFLMVALPPHQKEVFCVSVSADNSLIATGCRDKCVRLFDMATGNEVQKNTEHTDHVKTVIFNPENVLISGSLDQHLRIFSDNGGFEGFSQATRFVDIGAPITSLAVAPANCRFNNLIAVGTQSGAVHFVDVSWCSQQPLFCEAVRVAEDDSRSGTYDATRAMVEKFPLAVFGSDRSGNTLYHYAVMKEDDKLLGILLNAELPRFWLPVNHAGRDVLSIGVTGKSRTCLKMLLDKLISAKEDGMLAMLPSKHDRFLHNLMRMSADFDDLVAHFLSGFGLDDASAVVDATCTQLELSNATITVAGSAERAPPKFWATLLRTPENMASSFSSTTRMAARYVAIPNVASMMDSDPAIAAAVRRGSVMVPRRQTSVGATLSGATPPASPSSPTLSVPPPTPQAQAPPGALPKPASGKKVAAADKHIVRLRNSLLHTFVHCNNAQLFGNPTMKTVLQFKWDAFASDMFFKEIYLFSLRLFLFTLFTIVMSGLEHSEDDYWLEALSFVLALVLPFFGARQLQRQMQQYRRTKIILDPGATQLSTDFKLLVDYFSDGWNVLQVVSASLMILTCALFMFGHYYVRVVASLAAYTTWLECLYFLRAFEFTGGLVRMVFKVFYFTGPFMLILLVVVLGSANCFYVLFSNVPAAEELTFSSQDDPTDTFYKMFQMLVLGDVGDTYAAFSEDTVLSFVTKVIFALFMVGVNVFMLNLMIGLMGDFMEKIKDEEGDAFPFEKARIIAELELTLSEANLNDKKLFPRWLHVLVPKMESDSAADEWKGTVQAIRADNVLMERRSREAMSEMNKDITENIQQMENRVKLRLTASNDRFTQKLDAVTEQVSRLRSEMHDLRVFMSTTLREEMAAALRGVPLAAVVEGGAAPPSTTSSAFSSPVAARRRSDDLSAPRSPLKKGKSLGANDKAPESDV